MKLLRQLRTLLGFGAVICRAAADYRQRARIEPLTNRERADWLHRWSRMALEALRIDVDAQGPVPESGLIVANHLSYTDVLVLSAVAPCVFVSKSEVADWPIVGRLTRIAGTIYLRRECPKDAHRIKHVIEQRLADGQTVVVFPEGTSSDGSSVLPFHPSLFQSAIATERPIVPVHLSYSASDADPATDVCYWGAMTFAVHLWRLFGIKRIQARVRFGAGDLYADRKTAAIACRQLVLQLSMTA